MSDTRALLDRISTFRRRLEDLPPLTPHAEPGTTALALAGQPQWLERSLRTLTAAPAADGPLPPKLTVRARQLLEEARGLIAAQRELTADPVLAGLTAAADLDPGAAPDPLVGYHRETVALTEAALRMVQAFPESAAAQGRMCEGLDVMLRAVRDRLAITRTAGVTRVKLYDRVDGLARRLADLAGGRAVDQGWFAELGETILDDARKGGPVFFLSADPMSTGSFPGGVTVPAPARFVAAHALTVAQVAARLAPHDYEWAARPMVPVLAALLMDVGMLKVPAAALATPGPLTAADRRLVDDHPALGANLLRTHFPDAGAVADGVAAHHERPDGTGYPNAVMGDGGQSLGKLLAVCDHYAALCCDRPHRPAHDPRTALTDTLLAAEQGRLDRDFAEYLLNLSFHPVGTVVELTDGRVGVVVANHTTRANLRAAARPVVAVLTDRDRVVLPRPECVDLAAAEHGGVYKVLTAAERAALLGRDYPDLCWAV
ncbi:MAG: HD domain-containing phosphohydrolase [Gemmataceae bacterium]